jgi:glycosyltransferase involved in cell wall biosynthesis
MQPSLAVLITYFNEGALLRQCLESVLQGTDRPDEILVYDDASADRPEPHIPSCSAIRVIRGRANIGPARGRNVLLEAATADYIHYHDADDLFAPEWATKVRSIIAAAPDAVFTEVATFDDRGPVSDRMLGLRSLKIDPDMVRFCIRGAIQPASGTYRRELVRAIGGYRADLWQSEDYDFHVRLAAKTKRFEILEEPLVRIRLRSDGRSRRITEVYESAIKAVKLLSEELPRAYRLELANAAARFGSQLYQIGEKDTARQGFELARQLGPPALDDRSPLPRFLARSVGLEATEWLGSWYRKLVPEKLRRWVRRPSCQLPSAQKPGRIPKSQS